MKKTFLCILLVVFLICSGCGRAEAPAWLADYTKLWNITFEPGYTTSDNGYSSEWRSGADYIRLYINPGYSTCYRGDVQKLEKDGRQFFISDYGSAAPYAETGQYIWLYCYVMDWQNDGYVYTLEAHCKDKQTVLSFMTPETALSVESGGFKQPEFEIYNESAYTAFLREDKNVNVSVYFPPNGERYISEMMDYYGDYTLYDDEGLQYYMYTGEDTTGEDMIWNTDTGIISINISRNINGQFKKEEYGFIDADFARSITKQLGAKILPLTR